MQLVFLFLATIHTRVAQSKRKNAQSQSTKQKQSTFYSPHWPSPLNAKLSPLNAKLSPTANTEMGLTQSGKPKLKQEGGHIFLGPTIPCHRPQKAVNQSSIATNHSETTAPALLFPTQNARENCCLRERRRAQNPSGRNHPLSDKPDNASLSTKTKKNQKNEIQK